MGLQLAMAWIVVYCSAYVSKKASLVVTATTRVCACLVRAVGAVHTKTEDVKAYSVL